ncbi:retrotransposon protein, putative, ty1-copia subclass [Tanacetum coccineum]|uniref:Retrotransposon protein, putative, ty1-copia subclass n=1 Tax=Tanacetum coccineum TaxID=301880 RepID=A0ABQ4ZRG4_9ASTR
MKRGFLSQKGSGGGRGVKEKNMVVAAKDFISPSEGFKFSYSIYTGENGVDVVVPVKSIRAISERFANTAYGFFLRKRVAYLVVANYVRNTWGEYILVKSMLNSSTGLFSFQFSSMDGLNAMLENGPWFIRNPPLILKKWNPYVNLLKEDVGNVPVWVKLHGVPVTAFNEDGLSSIATKLGTLLMLDSYTSDMCLQSWGRSRYARAMIELRVDVELKDTIVVAMSKIAEEGFYTCTIRVEYKWKPSRCACCKVFGHIQEECPKNIGSGEAKNLKKPSQTPRGVPVGPKVGFKPTKEYRPISKKPTANTSGNKKKCVEPTKEVRNSNPFDVFNSIVNDVELGSNGRTSNLASNGANFSGSLFWIVETSSTSTTPIVDNIGKLEKLIIDGKVTLVDNDGKPLKKVDYPGVHDSADEVESVDNDIARSMASKRVGFGAKSLLEQCSDSYGNGDYDEYP